MSEQAAPAWTPAPEAATLLGFALFHLNLCFSSIEEEDRDRVIQRCYHPLLDLADAHAIPIGIEASGYTLEEIARRDPGWIARLRRLIAEGRAEWIGAGYAQAIGPLMPADVTAANLLHGNEVYEAVLGLRPTIALVNEQAYSGGLVGLYREAGYGAIVMDWDNCATPHPDWNPLWRYYPQRAVGSDGAEIGLIWTNTIAFQKLQRVAHGDLEDADYRAFLAAQISDTPRAFAIYGNDAECFDFRPGRFGTEAALHAEGEWRRLGRTLVGAAGEDGLAFVKPSDVLSLADHPLADQPLVLETPQTPIPVKKQPKYNVTRWAVTGRDDLAINTACARAYHRLKARGTPLAAPEYRELCYLWSSDFRTHITERRFAAYRARLAALADRLDAPPTRPIAILPAPRSRPTVRQGKRWIDIAAPELTVRLDARRGLAIESLAFGDDPNPVVGGLPHGHFADIALSADWYTGNLVFEAPSLPKVTDLEWTTPTLGEDSSTGRLTVAGTIATPLGPISKTLTIDPASQTIETTLEIDWNDPGRGALRVAHITLRPESYDWAALTLRTHNGGRTPERFALAGQGIDHGHAVSFLVSATTGLGLTEGWAEIADARRGIRVTVDRDEAALIGLLTHRAIGGSLFCQLQLSALELDETRRPLGPLGKRRFRYWLSPASI